MPDARMDAAVEPNDARVPLHDAGPEAAVPVDARAPDAGLCTAIQEDLCVRDPRCAAEHAFAAESPLMGTVFAACVPRAEVCSDGGTALTCASSPAGRLFVFPTTCLPPGWSERPGEDCDPAGVPPHCEMLDVETCATSAWCSTIEGRIGDFNGDPVALDCLSRRENCGDEVTCAQDGRGGPVFWFPNTCIPENWVRVECMVVEE